jgi:hypothetical protein
MRHRPAKRPVARLSSLAAARTRPVRSNGAPPSLSQRLITPNRRRPPPNSRRSGPRRWTVVASDRVGAKVRGALKPASQGRKTVLPPVRGQLLCHAGSRLARRHQTTPPGAERSSLRRDCNRRRGVALLRRLSWSRPPPLRRDRSCPVTGSRCGPRPPGRRNRHGNPVAVEVVVDLLVVVEFLVVVGLLMGSRPERGPRPARRRVLACRGARSPRASTPRPWPSLARAWPLRATPRRLDRKRRQLWRAHRIVSSESYLRRCTPPVAGSSACWWRADHGDA